MTFKPRLRLALMSVAVAIMLLPASNSAAAAADPCKHLSQQKMVACHLKTKAELKKPDKKIKQGAKPLITPLDILMFVL